MSLVTRCPACSTTFRVQPGQLAQRSGKVRCGKCNTVFDGLASLVSDADAAAELGPSPQLALFDPSRMLEAEEPAPPVAEPVAPAGADATQPLAVTTLQAGPAPSAAGTPSADAAATLPEPAFLAEPAPRQRFSVVWALLALIAFTGLVGQMLIHNRTEAALLVPELRPVLEIACEQLGCEVHLPRRPELMSIESSDLQTDPKREQVIQLTAVIRNRAPFPQEYPALEITLTNELDRPTVRRVLWPAQYLGAAGTELLARGIGPGAEAVVRMDFATTPDVRATGYRLYLFYP